MARAPGADFRLRHAGITPFALINPMARVLTIGERKALEGTVSRRQILEFMTECKRPVSLTEIRAAVPGIRTSAEHHMVRLISAGVVELVNGRYVLR